MESKLALARGIVSRYHSEEAAQRGEDYFTRVVREGRAPEDVPEVPLPAGDPVHLPKLLVELGLAPSTSEARRLVAQDAVKIDGDAVTELDVPRERLNHAVLQAGKRRFVRLTDET
jgi:tyrosyl-tRNA synthetase